MDRLGGRADRCGNAGARRPSPGQPSPGQPSPGPVACHLSAKASRGWDNAKKVNGRKRHIPVDTGSLLLEVLATPASVQDRDAARPLLFNLKRARRRIRRTRADSVYAGMLQPWAATYLKLTVEIVKRPPDQHTFQELPAGGWSRDPGLDHQLPPLRPRLRTPPRLPRSHRLLGP
ncbi:MAG: transposase [Streptosporangiaceae bacterium]